jgi:hypothetical protein
MDFELLVWVIYGIFALAFFISRPFIRNWIFNKEVEQMFNNRYKKDSKNFD